YTEVNGSPLFSDNWGIGIVKFTNGKYMKDVPLRFSLYNSELYSKKGDIEVMLVNSVREFSFSYEDNGSIRSVSFRNGYPGTKAGADQVFYEILVDGPRFQVLKHSNKTIREVSDYTSAPHKEFRLASELFIFDNQAQTLTQVKNKQPLAESVPVLAQEIARTTGNPTGKFRSEKDLIELVAKVNH
ncbi:MAG: hypothetical protein ABIS69_00220, partial [Sediminibacterium sp.]